VLGFSLAAALADMLYYQRFKAGSEAQRGKPEGPIEGRQERFFFWRTQK
jgi:hypothetical protein